MHHKFVCKPRHKLHKEEGGNDNANIGNNFYHSCIIKQRAADKSLQELVLNIHGHKKYNL